MILERILLAKKAEVASRRASCSISELRARPAWSEGRRSFGAKLRGAHGTAVIAEIKRASPSKGLIRADFDPARHARQYEGGGAVCLSVLTDESFFQGSAAHLAAARGACALPILRKDFVIDPYQIVESRACGADAVLLIVAALDLPRLLDLMGCARDEGLDVLVEVHDEDEIQVAVEAGADLVGINNRNLSTFETSLDVSRRLAPLIPGDRLVVSESGIRTPGDVASLRACGVHAFLVGEHLMAAEDPGLALASLVRP